jgi:hypothetical protein
MRRLLPFLIAGVVLLAAGVASFALGGTERRPSAVPPLVTPRLRALWDKDPTARAAAAQTDDELAPEEDAPVLNVVSAGGLPEEPGRHDFEQAMAKVRPRVDQCRQLEQFVGLVQVRVVIERSGGVKSAQTLPPLDETQTGQCVAKAVRYAAFPRFRGTLTPTIELIYPFYFRPGDN